MGLSWHCARGRAFPFYCLWKKRLPGVWLFSKLWYYHQKLTDKPFPYELDGRSGDVEAASIFKPVRLQTGSSFNQDGGFGIDKKFRRTS